MTDTGAPPGPADQASALVRDGQALFAAGHVERARECFERALVLAPDDEEARVGAERCVSLMATNLRPAGDTLGGATWAGGNPDSEDSDLGSPEATVVDPMYVREAQQEVARLQASMSTGDFPEPKTTPAGQMPHMPPPTPAQPAPLPRISSLAPAMSVSGDMVTTPEMPAMRPAGPRVEPDYPRASPAASRHYPELLPGGRQSQPSGTHAAPPPPTPPAPPPMSAPQPAPGYSTAPPGQAPYPPFATPSPMGGPLPYLGRPARWQIILAGVGGGAALIGFLIGMAVFRSSSDDAAKPAAGAIDAGTSPTPPRTRDAGAAAVPTTPTPTTPTQIVSRAASITHPLLATITAPFDGEVTRVHARAGATVERDARLFSIRKKKKKDKDKDKDAEPITAPEAGLFTPAVDKGATVADKDVLGALLDPSRYAITFDLPADAASLTWSCEAASADGAARAPCTIDRLDRLPTFTRATATVAADAAAWLAQPNPTATLTITPR
ncbi:MAG TPA: hypothetical protein VMZ28_18560 [Kofleriaceae bacterium]|nr:hypothetical protein [Kofleriaceae bacterium]